MLYLLLFDRIFCGEPVPTSPENALSNQIAPLVWLYFDAGLYFRSRFLATQSAACAETPVPQADSAAGAGCEGRRELLSRCEQTARSTRSALQEPYRLCLASTPA
jgi:hypothetical protein